MNAARLIERAQRGEGAAQDELWRTHRRWVAAIVLAHMPRTMDVDDLMQDVALKMIDKLDTLRDAAAFKPWLRRIIINTCRGAARAMKPSFALYEPDRDDIASNRSPRAAVPESHEPDSAKWIETRDAAQRLLTQVMTLPTEYREPLLLRCVHSMTYQQIAEILELPITTIETRLARARRMLREEVGESVGDRGDRGDGGAAGSAAPAQEPIVPDQPNARNASSPSSNFKSQIANLRPRISRKNQVSEVQTYSSDRIAAEARPPLPRLRRA